MAIGFARAEYVQRSKGQSSVSAAAYQSRTQLYDERLGKNTRRWVDDGTLIHHEVLLPADADQRFADPAFLWNAAEFAERRIDSVVARQVVMALPRDDLSHEELIELARSFAKEHWVSKGYAVQIDIHGGPNPHIHSLISTRYIEGGSLGRLKARDTDVRMAYGRPVVTAATAWGELWAEHQRVYFERHGKPIVVDPVAPVPGRHIGPKRFRHPNDPRIAENAKRQEMSATLARDPQSAAEVLSKQRIYRGTGVERFFDKHVADPELRKLVQAETLSKLAAIQHAALLKASQADLTGAGGPITLEYVARGLSPKLDAVLWETTDLREKARANDHQIRQSIEGAEQGKSRIQQRKETISRPRKLLHDALGVSDYLLKHWGDAALNQGTTQQARSEGWGKKLRFEKKRIADRLSALQLQASALLEGVRPAAQQELEVRRRIARNARAELQSIEKPDRTLRVRRTPTLRP